MFNAAWIWFCTFWASRAWMPVAIIVIWYVVRLCADDTKFPVNIPARWRPVVVVVLGQVYAALVAVNGGLPWGAAAMHGLEAAAWTMGLFDLAVKALWNGRAVPAWVGLVLGLIRAEIPEPAPEPRWHGPKRG